MKPVIRSCVCAISLYHLDFILFMFRSHSWNQDEFTVSFISRRKFIFLFFEEAVWMCSLCELSWPFGLQSWCPGSIYNKFFISGSKFIWHQWRQLLELEPLLFHLAISISDCLCLAHILEIRMNSLSVSFQDGSSCSYFSRKLFEFWAYANSLDHLDFSLAVFYNKNFISGSKFLYQSMKAMLELVIVLFLLATRFQIVYTYVWLT